MTADIFRSSEAYNLLQNKQILLFGDSNMRALYKDLTWLLEHGTLIPKAALQRKNELSHANDVRLSNGQLTASRNYVEVREYNRDVFLHYEFITRLHQPAFVETIESSNYSPDVLIINSCLWDLSRWGPNGVSDFKINLRKTMQLLKERLPAKTRVIWTTTLPPSFKCRGGFLTKEIDFIRNLLPFNVVEANTYIAGCAEQYQFDVLDLHYNLRFLIDMRRPDGIHFGPSPVRYLTNLLLTHLCLCWNKPLPGNAPLDSAFVGRSEKNVGHSACGQLIGELEAVAHNLNNNRLEVVAHNLNNNQNKVATDNLNGNQIENPFSSQVKPTRNEVERNRKIVNRRRPRYSAYAKSSSNCNRF